MKNSPWRGTYDAIVTDPPYNLRTSLLCKSTVTDSNIDEAKNNVLMDLISFASSHLAPKGRLVFWWPDGTSVSIMTNMS